MTGVQTCALPISAASIVLKSAIGVRTLADGPWPEALFVITAATSIILAFSRAIPFQNVLLASTAIGSVASLVFLIDVLLRLKTPLPLGSCPCAGVGRPEFRDFLPWHIPLNWIVIVLASRGTAQFLLSVRRNTSRYGWELMACTTILCLILIAGMQAFCGWPRGRYPLRPFSFDPLRLFGVSPSTFFVWMVVTLIALVIATPVLIDKKPVNSPPGIRPLLLWITLSLVFATAAMQIGLWVESALLSAAAIVVTMFAMYKRSRSEP